MPTPLIVSKTGTPQIKSRQTKEPLYCKAHRVTHVEEISVFYKNPHSTSQTQSEICTFPIHKWHVHVYTHTVYNSSVDTALTSRTRAQKVIY